MSIPGQSYGAVTAALKRAVELQPAAEDRSFQVVIDGKRTWQSQRLVEVRFGSASRVSLIPGGKAKRKTEDRWDKSHRSFLWSRGTIRPTAKNPDPERRRCMGIYKVKDRRGRTRYVVSKYWPNGSGRLRKCAPNYRSAQVLQTRVETGAWTAPGSSSSGNLPVRIARSGRSGASTSDFSRSIANLDCALRAAARSRSRASRNRCRLCIAARPRRPRPQLYVQSQQRQKRCLLYP